MGARSLVVQCSLRKERSKPTLPPVASKVASLQQLRSVYGKRCIRACNRHCFDLGDIRVLTSHRSERSQPFRRAEEEGTGDG